MPSGRCRGPSGSGPWRPPFWSGNAGGIDTNAAPIDLLGCLQSQQEHFVELLPDAGVLPVAKASPAGNTAAAVHLWRQHLPRDAALEHEENACESGSIGNRRSSSFGTVRGRWQKRFHHRPKFIRNQWLWHAVSLAQPQSAVLKSALSCGRCSSLACASLDTPRYRLLHEPHRGLTAILSRGIFNQQVI